MEDFILDYPSLLKKLEKQELTSTIASPQLYGQLLAIHLLLNDLTSAKFLWKRIPDNLKQSNKELKLIWQVGQCLWRKEYHEVYSIVKDNPNWPNHLKNIMNLVVEATRKRAIILISNAYSSIKYSDASKLLGLEEDKMFELAQSCGWTVRHETRYIQIPANKSVNKSDSLVGPDKGTELLNKLTDYTVFLESIQ